MSRGAEGLRLIIECERCQTRFQLDDTLVPAQGARVRCSRCKHAFFVRPPDVSDGEVVDQLAFDAATLRGTTPNPATDLEREVPEERPEVPEERPEVPEERPEDARTRVYAAEQPGERPEDELTRAFATERSPANAAAEEPEEEDWEFNEDLPAADPAVSSPARPAPSAPARPAPAPRRRPAPAAPPAAESGPELDFDPVTDFLADEPEPEAEQSPQDSGDFGELGSPEDWDLLSDGPAGAPPPPPPALEAPPVASAPAEPVERVESPPRSSGAVRVPPAELEAARDVLAPEPRSWSSRLGHAAGWCFVLVASAVAAWGGLAPSVLPPPAAPDFARVAGLRVQDVRGQLVENAGAGWLFVVSGTLSNPAETPRALRGPMAVRLLDAEGAPLDQAPAWLAPAPGEKVVRESQPGALLRAQEQAARSLAAEPMEPGSSLAFAAIFPELPDEARSFRFEGETAPLPVAEATTSEASPPEPRPSSE